MREIDRENTDVVLVIRSKGVRRRREAAAKGGEGGRAGGERKVAGVAVEKCDLILPPRRYHNVITVSRQRAVMAAAV